MEIFSNITQQADGISKRVKNLLPDSCLTNQLRFLKVKMCIMHPTVVATAFLD